MENTPIVSSSWIQEDETSSLIFFGHSLNNNVTKSFPPTAWIIKLATLGNPSSRELSESSSRSTVTMFY